MYLELITRYIIRFLSYPVVVVVYDVLWLSLALYFCRGGGCSPTIKSILLVLKELAVNGITAMADTEITRRS